MVGDVLKMIRDIRSASPLVDAWGAALNLPQIVGGLLLLGTLEGRLVLGTVLLTLVLASHIHKRAPFSRSIALCHLPWLALAPWLFHRLQSTSHGTAFQLWGYYVLVTILISLVLDGHDLFLYWRGATTYAWSTR
jgi:hypothetical protein